MHPKSFSVTYHPTYDYEVHTYEYMIEPLI
jgi:hypothetical protein